MFDHLLKFCAPFCLALFVSVPLFGAEEVVSLTTQDGWILSALYQSAQENNRTVVLLHDLGKNKEQFSTFKSALAKEGFGYLALDLRGHGQSTNQEDYRRFAREGVDNQFNKMTRDVDAALTFLDKKRIPSSNIAVLGSGLGANVAAKSMTFWPDTPLLALISPTTNNRAVLSIPAMRLYKGNSLIAAGAADKKMFLEASVLRNVAFLTAGEGNVTFLTAYDLTSHEMLDKYLIPSLLQWLKTPQKPELLPDEPENPSDENSETEGIMITPSDTEESLFPSVLGNL